MVKKTEISFRIHGFGGQGIRKMTRILGRLCINAGFHAQCIYDVSNPNEPGVGYVKLSNENIIDKSIVENPDFLIILDTSLNLKECLAGLKENESIVLFNTDKKVSLATLKSKKVKHHEIDANRIAMETLGKPLPNTVMLGAIVKKFNKFSLKALKSAMEEEIEDVDANMKAAEEGFKAVK